MKRVMSKIVIVAAIVFMGMGTTSINAQAAAADPITPVSVYRAYNANNGEHLFTQTRGEYDNLVRAGWKGEGVAYILDAGRQTVQVHRLYNRNSGEHVYTSTWSEVQNLVANGWKHEGLAFATASPGNGYAVYRLYNRNATGQFEAGSHHYTQSAAERDRLVAVGWKYEGVAYYAVNPSGKLTWVPASKGSKKWVVDVAAQAAWDEPVYTQCNRFLCNGCNADLTITLADGVTVDSENTIGAIDNHLCPSLPQEEIYRGTAGYHGGVITLQTGNINHPAVAEKGHWQTTGKRAGYWY
ncbi:MAG: hypothetical protein ACK5MN_00400 [Lachnospiraceae bacterium]